LRPAAAPPLLTFRFATPADAPALGPLIESAYRGDSARAGWSHEADLLSGERLAAAELAALLAAPHQRVILAELVGATVGCAAITDCGPPESGTRLAYLGLLCVSPALQAGGLGRALIAEAEARGRRLFAARRMEMTVISARTELIAWYERRGYALTGETRPFPVQEGAHLVMPARESAHFIMVVLEKPLT
jgi:GNAT superfamily N-acetyltransferase